jgi:hypothetical protein
MWFDHSKMGLQVNERTCCVSDDKRGVRAELFPGPTANALLNPHQPVICIAAYSEPHAKLLSGHHHAPAWELAAWLAKRVIEYKVRKIIDWPRRPATVSSADKPPSAAP